MAKKHKRKFREHANSIEGIKRFKAASGRIGNPKISNMVEPTSYQLQGVHRGWTDVVTVCPIYQQSLDIEHGNITMESSGGGGAQLHTTTTKTYDPITMKCLVCVGAREGHHILDNFGGKGITILLGDQHCPAVVTSDSTSCVVVMRYSNTTRGEQHEYMMLPVLKHQVNFQSKDRGGFSEVVQHALHEGMQIKLAVC